MTKFKALILAIAVIIILNSRFLIAESPTLKQDTIILLRSDYKILDSTGGSLKVVVIQEEKLNTLLKTKNPMLNIQYEGKFFIGKGLFIYKAAVPKNCDYFFPTDKQGYVVLFNNVLRLLKVQKRNE